MIDKFWDFMFGLGGLVVLILVAVMLSYWLNNKAKNCIKKGGTVTYINGSYSGCVMPEESKR